MKIWKAHYKDKNHDLEIDIINTEGEYSTNPLSFTINGITFHGTSLGDFQLADTEQYDKAREEFSFLKWGGRCTKYNLASEYCYDLQRYSLGVKIPISLIRKKDNQSVQGYIRLCFEYQEPDITKAHCIIMCDDTRVYRDEVHVSVFALEVDGRQFSIDCKDLYFERNLLKLNRMIKNEYIMHCCFTCQYSDYSPYGNDDFGTMLCYKKYKAEYLKVNTKDEYFEHLEGLDCEAKQETYLCEEYEPRGKCEGYRGFVE